ncbi:phospho-N-acetylmuramoyl-pentapeptide-transferase, partial [Pseudomonas sp. Pseusp97]
PTMGGVVFLLVSSLVALVVGLAFGHLNFTLLSGVVGVIFFGGIGFADDFLKIFRKQNEGLNRAQKFISQLIGSALFVGIYL